jgi:hypothetical protein
MKHATAVKKGALFYKTLYCVKFRGCVSENLRLYWIYLRHPECIVVKIMLRSVSLNCVIIDVVLSGFTVQIV